MRSRLSRWLAPCAVSISWTVTPAPAHPGWSIVAPTHEDTTVDPVQDLQKLLIERMIEGSSTPSGLFPNGPAALALVGPTAPIGHDARLTLAAAASGLAVVIAPTTDQDIASGHFAVAAAGRDTPGALGGPARSGLMSGRPGGSGRPPSLGGMAGLSARPGGGAKPSSALLLASATAGGERTPGAVASPSDAGMGPLFASPTPGSLDTAGSFGGGPGSFGGGPGSFGGGPGSFGGGPSDSGTLSPNGLDPVHAPEPASLTAAGIGIVSSLGYCWVRRRKPAAAT